MQNPINSVVVFLSCGLTAYYLLYVIWGAYYQDDWNSRKSNLVLLGWDEDIRIKNIHQKYQSPSISPEITIVTAYFDLGSFKKGQRKTYTPNLYKKWMSVFGRITNPLIVYTDSKEVLEIFTKLRSVFPAEKSVIRLINRSQLWSFSVANKIKDIFATPGYPRFEPNTVNENYSCVMHSKFELVNKAIEENLVKTLHVSWLDIGLFRHAVHESHPFHLDLLPDFDNTKVSYSQPKEYQESLSAKDVIYNNMVWVCGAMFVGRSDVVFVYTEDYMKTVKQLLSMNLMNTDQQVIYTMYLPSFNIKPRVELQVYTTHSGDDWFNIGYEMKDMWDKKLRKTKNLSTYLFKYM